MPVISSRRDHGKPQQRGEQPKNEQPKVRPSVRSSQRTRATMEEEAKLLDAEADRLAMAYTVLLKFHRSEAKIPSDEMGRLRQKADSLRVRQSALQREYYAL